MLPIVTRLSGADVIHVEQEIDDPPRLPVRPHPPDPNLVLSLPGTERRLAAG